MSRRRRTPIEDLRTAIDCLPVETRLAMLDGIRSNDIIVGAYTDRNGGVCPMLAAHRCGGRTSFISFARAWDGFTRAGKRSRRATERELLVLTAHLEASLLAEERVDLQRAITDHRRLMAAAARPKDRRRARLEAEGAAPAAPRAPASRPGDPDRARELAGRHGWAWLRPFRRLDDYQRALEQVRAAEQERAGAGTERERELVG